MMDTILYVYAILLFMVYLSDVEGEINLGELNCMALLQETDCPVNEICKGHCQDACTKNDDFVIGTGVYPFFSPICKSASHDFRISAWNSSERTFWLKVSTRSNFLYSGSVKNRIESLSIYPSNALGYEFTNSYISESILDVISIHENYLYRKDDNHTQNCLVTSQSANVKYYSYYGKNNGQQVESLISAGVFKGIKILWPVQVAYLRHENEKKRPNAGFQCVPVNNSLSIVTSLAFRRDAYFFPKDFTITVNINENVTLDMLETKLREETKTIWKKDGKELHIVPTSSNRTSITLTNVGIGYSGIYSLEYSLNNLQRRGYLRLIVRACPAEKYGPLCSSVCPGCLNGGICHDITGTCICAPGFGGSNCEEACEEGFVGRNCSVPCNLDEETDKFSCKGLLICLPDPYGCSCAAGYFGINCNETCEPGTYGAGCKQKRSCKCADSKNCDIYSGICKRNCTTGWYGKYCNETPVGITNLSYDPITPFAVNLTWDCLPGPFSSVKYYNVTYKHIEWKTQCHTPLEGTILQKNATTTNTVLEKLLPFSFYSVRVSAVTVVAGPPLSITIETPEVAPLPPRNFLVSHKTSSTLFLSWLDPYPPGGVIDSYEISYNNHAFTKVISKDKKGLCDSQNNLNCFVMKNLTRNHEYEIQLTAFNANISESSEPVIITERTHISDIQDDIVINISEQKGQQVTLFLYQKNYAVLHDSTTMTRSYYVIVDLTEKNHTTQDFSMLVNLKSNCDYVAYKTFTAGIIAAIPISGINFTIGDNSCKNGYYNSPLKIKETYRFGILPVISNCKETIYGPIIYTDKISIKLQNKENRSFGSLSSARSFKIALGFLLPLTVILLVGTLFVYLRKPKSFDNLLPKKRFLRAKAIGDFAASNDGLDDFDIIETESINEDISYCIAVTELPSYVKDNGKNNKIRKEFVFLPKGQMYPCIAAKQSENKFKNRYGNILPYDHTRVILKENGDTDYIHANYVDGYKTPKKYIATQGPMSQTILDFWSMVWQEKVSKMVMITNLEENGKTKCEKYWPEDVNTYGTIEVSYKGSENYADFIIRTFTLSKDEQIRDLKHFHFNSWPDHGVPLNTTPFLNFLKKVQVNANPDEPIIVHCSAGIGRTGAVILFENSFDMGNKEGKVDILGQLCSMRKQRMNIVETYEQYLFILHALVEALCIENTSISENTFLKEYEAMNNINNEASVITIEQQFQMLKDLPSLPLPADVLAAYMVNNQPKNRSMHILPSERARPILQKQPNYSDYINAVYIDGYRNKNKCIATQYPLPETIIDFWRMVFELKSKVIFLLQDIPYSDPKSLPLWPLNGTLNLDLFEIHCDSVEDKNVFEVFNLVVQHKESLSKLPLKAIHIKCWSVDEQLPSSSSALFSAIKWFRQWEKELANETIISVCLDGVTACGIFCSFLYILEHLKEEKEINIFQTVKCIRTNRPQFITNMDQYRFLFELTKSYLENN
ncbi:hypothetical protein JTE90_011806 [Oedothorax gibbosus]|uniref:protein-tyrosine-phosphatase n=1 Tax=Oedothorax gibbosus TaxID=931172 RepID=A0AAV6VTC2_9ARAC|nr:hypothetical protein JTE90_011806 [Oedothorax gibbosus]